MRRRRRLTAIGDGPSPSAARASSAKALQSSYRSVRLLRERTREDRVELVVREQWSRLLLHVRPERLRLGLAPERRRPGEQLVEHAGQRVLVGATVHLAACGSAPGAR